MAATGEEDLDLQLPGGGNGFGTSCFILDYQYCKTPIWATGSTYTPAAVSLPLPNSAAMRGNVTKKASAQLHHLSGCFKQFYFVWSSCLAIQCRCNVTVDLEPRPTKGQNSGHDNRLSNGKPHTQILPMIDAAAVCIEIPFILELTAELDLKATV